ncbi:kelch-like protein 17 [Topomyia yanbarensis]|uniref:kelch-like protein 17 n=1 Tax=Topomyia yanbarensis TaxID=2498891 RepID=UPI00273AD813|nr:kelch-like protein 17 [Topomyia yanbarensis]XP_058818194.1 kelch-like protein 17 [Topomyia yanbarensis]XP_058818195.1 kelch-like protein 17 [Topomyia yanbarensis]XP_058818197.1 kelch-like protein 17 [Topomyia yanbarensis]XP_058818198.1 kelch-like protein 17 [Topomyia yanbarensis]XP_058818199.1 kelch-like protein 17 [Topomyia yanbarensis]
MFLPVKSNTSPVAADGTNGEDVTTVTSNSTQTPSDLSPPNISSDDMLPQAYHQNPGHCIASFSAISRMRHNAQLCDVTLEVGGETINAHKVILASVSPYFYAMFNDDMLERNRDVVTLHDIDPSSLKQLIDYAYSGEITITEENVQVLLPASSLLQIQSVREACCKFLLRQLHPSNCLGIRSFADAHSCKELHSRSHRYALQNFQQVVGTEEFLLLGFSEVQDLISNSQLNICSEEKVFMAVLNWIKHDLNERKKHISELMSHVRLPLVNREFLMSCVETEPLVREDFQCKELLLEAMKYHLLPEQRSSLVTQRTLERRPEGMRQYLFAVGGGSLFAIHNECECYNPKTNAWMTISPMISRRSRAGVAALRKLLYVVGGYDGENDLASAECYNPLTNEWCNITPMGTKRSCLGTCAFDGLLYVCGGYDGASCLASVERFDPLTAVWTSCPAMNTRRRYCRVAVMDNCIYALGGFDSSNYQSSVERFDPRVGSWTAVPSMTSRRSSCGVAALDGYLYCIGGSDGTMCMQTGERFNLRANSWEPISPMHSRRSTHEVVEANGYLYALGGNDGSSSLNSVERYEPKLNKWTIVTSMLTRRSSIGASVLECFNLERGLLQTSI